MRASPSLSEYHTVPVLPNVMCRFVASHISAKSRFHKENEDSYFVGDNLIVVADGMGGEACGDVASDIAVRTIVATVGQCEADNLSYEAARELLFSSISNADSAILEYIETHPEAVGMGTTVLIALLGREYVHIAWCGDSRGFLFNDGRVKSLTKDHSYVQDLIDSHQITIEESFTHPDNNLITRYVGGGKNMCLPAFDSYRIKKGDLLVFCSDGLSGYCPLEDIRRCIVSSGPTPGLPSRLLELSRKHGSDDDITIVTLAAYGARRGHPSSFFGWIKRVISRQSAKALSAE